MASKGRPFEDVDERCVNNCIALVEHSNANVPEAQQARGTIIRWRGAR